MACFKFKVGRVPKGLSVFVESELSTVALSECHLLSPPNGKKPPTPLEPTQVALGLLRIETVILTVDLFFLTYLVNTIERGNLFYAFPSLSRKKTKILGKRKSPRKIEKV